MEKIRNSLTNKRDIIVLKEKLKVAIKPKKYFHFKYGSKRGNALVIQLHLGISFLISHSFHLGMEELPFCDICHFEENMCHYMLSCTLFTLQREVLFKTVSELVPKLMNFTKKKKLDILLYGMNINLDIRDCQNVPLTPSTLSRRCFCSFTLSQK